MFFLFLNIFFVSLIFLIFLNSIIFAELCTKVSGMKHEILIQGIADLDRAAGEFLEKTSGHNLIAFFAPMGAGKTTFTTAICRSLGVRDAVCSPTFTIVNEYVTSTGVSF